ncbi:MAG: MarR family transcriptional regulator [Acholeplasmatales bacterium]|nr:MarR family transcriptional regulator [Acholeplasmatales bacterium]
MDKYDSLKLENQLCFPLYAAAKEITRKYKPFLDKLDLTYTQYICMMVMWEHKELNVKTIGEYIYLDSGTLTPLLKKLEDKGYIERKRNDEDERNLVISITDKGLALRDEALSVPQSMGACIALSREEAELLYKVLYKILNNISK